MRQIVTKLVPEELQGGYAGMKLAPDSFDVLVSGEDATVVLADGTLVGAFRASAIDPRVAEEANIALRSFRTVPVNRGMAVIGEGGARPIRASGKRSKTNEVTPTVYPEVRGITSGIVGFYERVIRTPYCRACAWNASRPEEWTKVVRLAQEVGRVFRESAPARYEAQEAEMRRVLPCWKIPGTPFTTITVNRNWQTRVHKDAGDFEPGFGTLTVHRKGEYKGAYFVMPTLRPRVAFDMRNGDVLLSDVHQWHGNTPLDGIPGRFERMSFVFYMRAKMVGCGSPEEELRQAQLRKAGQPLFSPADVMQAKARRARAFFVDAPSDDSGDDPDYGL